MSVCGKSSIRNFGICGLLVASFLGVSAQANEEVVPGEYIIKLKPKSSSSSVGRLSMKISAKGASMGRQLQQLGMLHLKNSDAALAADLKNEQDVDYIEPNYRLRKLDEPGMNMQTYSESQVADLVPLGQEALGLKMTYSSLPGAEAMALAASQYALQPATVSGTGRPIIAVVDTGVDINHTSFQRVNAIWQNPYEIPGNGIDDDNNGFVDDVYGWNFVSRSGAMVDDDGHGTHVAGIALGVGSNIFSSSAPTSQVQIMPLKFLDGSGGGSTADAIAAIYYAVDNGAAVINASWGGNSYSRALHEAIAYSYYNGVSFIAASGNSKSNNDSKAVFPSSLDVPNLVSVAATTDWDELASFSNFGAHSVNIGSPGVSILSTVPGNSYGYSSGTSMAAPFISGIAALAKVVNPSLSGYDIRSLILQEGDRVATLSGLVTTEARVSFTPVIESASTLSAQALPSYSLTGYRGLASTEQAVETSSNGCAMVLPLSALNGSGGGRPPWLLFMIVVLGALPFAAGLWVLSRPEQNSVEATRVSDLRVHERFQLNTSVVMSVNGREIHGTVGTISQGGVSLKTEQWLERGGSLTMMISSPDGKEKIEVDGRIVWSEPKQAYGVQFSEAKESVKDRIASWSKSLVKAN